MLRLVPVLLAMAAVSCASAMASSGDKAISPALAEALEGRTAGKPVDCIGLRQQAQSSTIVDKAIIYKESRRRWWVNVPQNGDCSVLKPHRALVTVTPGARLCSLDLVRIVDTLPAFDYGQCALGKFTPYTR